MVSLVREVWSRTDYILGTDRCLFNNLAVQDPRHNSDHYMFLVYLHIDLLREHTKYLGRCTKIPIRSPTTSNREEIFFAALRRAIPKPKAREARKNLWILADMWRLIDKRVSARWGPSRNQTLFNVSLKGGRRPRTNEVGEEIERLLRADPPSTRNPGTGWRGVTGLRSTARHRPLRLPSSG